MTENDICFTSREIETLNQPYIIGVNQVNSTDENRKFMRFSSEYNITVPCKISSGLKYPAEKSSCNFIVYGLLDNSTHMRCFSSTVRKLIQVRLFSSVEGQLMSTYPDLSEITPQQKLLLLSNNTEKIFKNVQKNNFRYIINNITSLNLSIRELALSKDLPEDVSNALVPLSNSLDECNRLIFEGLRNENIREVMANTDILEFLKGAKNLLQLFSKME